MKKLMIASSSLAAVSLAGFAGAVDVTLGGSIDMGIEFGLGKTYAGLSAKGSRNEVTLSISAAHTTDGGLAFGGRFTVATSAEIEFDPYTDAAGEKLAVRMTVDGRTNITANLWNVSGGSALSAGDVVAVKINSDWLEVDAEQEELFFPLGAFTSSNICMLAGRGRAVGEIFSDLPGQFTNAPFPIYMDLGLEAVKGDYLPAGQVLSVQVGSTLTTGNPSYTFQMRGQTGPNKSLTMDVATTRGAGAVFTDGRGFNLNTSTSIRSVVVTSPSAPRSTTKGSSTFPVIAAEKFAVDVDGDRVAWTAPEKVVHLLS